MSIQEEIEAKKKELADLRKKQKEESKKVSKQKKDAILRRDSQLKSEQQILNKIKSEIHLYNRKGKNEKQDYRILQVISALTEGSVE